MVVQIPVCPVCKNDSDILICRNMTVVAEDSTRRKDPAPVGAGVTANAFEMLQLRATQNICRKCGALFMTDFVTSSKKVS